MLGPFIAIGLYELSRRREQDPTSRRCAPLRSCIDRHSERSAVSACCSQPFSSRGSTRPTSFTCKFWSIAVPPPSEFIRPGDDNRKRHAAHHRRQRRGIFVCGIRARDQRRLVPDARRPQRQRRNGRQNIRARRDREPNPDRAMGTDRRLFAPDRSGAAARWTWRSFCPSLGTRRGTSTGNSSCPNKERVLLPHTTSRPPTHAEHVST